MTTPDANPKLFATRPNPATPLGRAYALTIEEIRGSISHDDMVWLNANPLLWVRAIGLHRHYIHYEMEIRIARLNWMKPESGTDPSSDYLKAKKQHRAWWATQNHTLEALHVRRQEVAMAFGVKHFTEITTTADLLLTFTKIQEAAKRQDWQDIVDYLASWIEKLTPEQVIEEIRPVPPEPEPEVVDARQYLLSFLRRGN